MVTKTKKSVSLSNSLLKELAKINKEMNISEFIENALVYYIHELKRQERIKKDIEIISANADRFNKEAEENLLYQVSTYSGRS
jgi:metal-responsive CopG/Arc/MetJ family transcriptional regulator